MKLLFITTDITVFGGIERVISRVTKGLIDKYGYDIEIISLYKNNKNNHKTNFIFDNNIKISYHDLEQKFRKSKNKLDTFILLVKNQLNLFKSIRNIILQSDVDVIITFHPTISIATILNKKIIKGKLIVTEHSEYSNSPDKLTFFLRKLLFKKADNVVVLTESSKKIYNKFTNNVSVIPNPISFKSDKVSDLNNKKIIAAGRLEMEKGFDRLIQSFNIIKDKNPKWSLDIFGNGSEKENLINQIKELNLDSKVKVYPFTNTLKEEMLNSDIFVIPSRSESFSLVLLEAMECGLPCVSYNTCGPSEIIQNNKNGIIVDQGDIISFSKALDFLMNNYDKRTKYGKNAKNYVKKYSLDNIVFKWYKLLN